MHLTIIFHKLKHNLLRLLINSIQVNKAKYYVFQMPINIAIINQEINGVSSTTGDF
jgi:hypothetical protein